MVKFPVLSVKTLIFVNQKLKLEIFEQLTSQSSLTEHLLPIIFLFIINPLIYPIPDIRIVLNFIAKSAILDGSRLNLLSISRRQTIVELNNKLTKG